MTTINLASKITRTQLQDANKYKCVHPSLIQISTTGNCCKCVVIWYGWTPKTCFICGPRTAGCCRPFFLRLIPTWDSLWVKQLSMQPKDVSGGLYRTSNSRPRMNARGPEAKCCIGSVWKRPDMTSGYGNPTKRNENL